MTVISRGRVVEDRWTAIDDDQPLTDYPIISLARWEKDQQHLRRRNRPVGLALDNNVPVDAVADALDHIDLIALAFPKFTDGRAYSQARQLREQLGFTGELRATGQIGPDQFGFLDRCGFDSIETETLADWDEHVDQVSVFFQPTGASPAWAQRQRHER